MPKKTSYTVRIRLQGALTFLRQKNLHYHNQTPLGGGFYNVLVCFLLIPENIMIVKKECNSSLFCNMNHLVIGNNQYI